MFIIVLLTAGLFYTDIHKIVTFKSGNIQESKKCYRYVVQCCSAQRYTEVISTVSSCTICTIFDASLRVQYAGIWCIIIFTW